MVPGDYYVVRVRPTGWLLRPRVLSSVSPASCHRSSFHDALPSVFVLSYGSIDADVRIYGVCVQFTCTHTHAYIGKGHNPHERSRLHTRACRHPHSLVTMERWDEGGGGGGSSSNKKLQNKTPLWLVRRMGGPNYCRFAFPHREWRYNAFKSASSACTSNAP